jgi:hypothetical protein
MRVNVYIRKENEKKWLKIADKSAWVNGLLNPSENPRPDLPTLTIKAMGRDVDIIHPDTIAIMASNKVTCKIHGIPLDDRGRCMQKGCKYS